MEAYASWSFYGTYDYTEKNVVENAEDNTSIPAYDEEKDVQEDGAIRVHPQAQARSDYSGDTDWLEQDFDSSDLNNPEYREYLTKFKYVLYYGGFDSKVADAIISVKPTLLITNYQAIDPDMRKEFARNNISVIAYLPIHWTDRSLESTLDEARDLILGGADGLFIDEAPTISTDWEFWYHGRIYETAKQLDKDAVVIINPGSASISERAMQVADIVCFEHEWRDIANLSWAEDYPGWRFMGISSNEFVKVMGYHVGAGSAHEDLEEARSLNIAYHYSADHYIWLPSWLDVYGGIAMSLHPVSEYIDLDLNPVAEPETSSSDIDSDEPPDPIKPDDPDPKDLDEQDDEEEPGPPQNNSESPTEQDENGRNDDDPDRDPRPEQNESPIAHAGQDQSLSISADERLTVNLDGMASSDPDSQKDTLSFTWEQIDGPEVDLEKANSAIASFVLYDSLFTDDSELRFRFELTVTDSDGDKDSDLVAVRGLVEKPIQEQDDAGGRDSNNMSDSETDLKEGAIDVPSEEPSENRTESLANSTGSNIESGVLVREEQSSVNSNATATP